jgi:hypothetical protein
MTPYEEITEVFKVIEELRYLRAARRKLSRMISERLKHMHGWASYAAQPQTELYSDQTIGDMLRLAEQQRVGATEEVKLPLIGA